MAQSFDHLTEQTRASISWSKSERVAYNWRDSWIRYKAAEGILAELEDAFNRPTAIRPLNELIVAPAGNGKTALLGEVQETHRNILLTSPPGNGKTGILANSMAQHPEVTTDPVQIKPVVYVLTPADCNEGKLWSEFLRGLGYDDYAKGSIITKKRIVLNALIQCQTKLILVDEVHNMLTGRAKAESALAVLKNISTETGRPIVFAGTEDASEVLEYDSQLTTRLDKLEIPLWENDYELGRLLHGIEATLSLRIPSNLHEDPLKTKIFELSKSFDTSPVSRRPGILVNLLKVTRFAAGYAIRDGTERITVRHLELAAAKKQWRGSVQKP
jgi:hypothetical protein